MNEVKIIKEILNNSKLDETRKFMILKGFWGKLNYYNRGPGIASPEEIIVSERACVFFNYMSAMSVFDRRVDIKHWEALCPIVNKCIRGIMEAPIELLSYDRRGEIPGYSESYRKRDEIGTEPTAKKIVPYDVYNSWFEMGN